MAQYRRPGPALTLPALERLDPNRPAARVQPKRVAALPERAREVAARNLAAHCERQLGLDAVSGGLDREVRRRIELYFDAAAGGLERPAERVAPREAGHDPAAGCVRLDPASGLDDADAAAGGV